MAGYVPPQLTPFLGDDLEAIDAAALQQLVGQPETDVLEFKSEHYGNSDGQKNELALDLTAFANTAGGLMIVGMAEDDATGVATGLVALDSRTEEDTRYRLIIAGNVSPNFAIHASQLDVTVGGVDGTVLLVSVEPSPLRPHAVRRSESLRYAIRDGRNRRCLQEWEVADAYRRRDEGIRAAIERADDVRSRLIELLGDVLAGGVEDDPDYDGTSVWLVMALSPDRPGDMRIGHGAVADTREWVERVRTVPTHFLAGALEPIVGFRSLELVDQDDPRFRHHSRLVAVLTTTGAGAAAFRLEHPASQPDFHDPTVIPDVWLSLGALTLAELLAAHAIDRCATGGTATALVNVEVIGDIEVTLAHSRRYRGLLQRVAPGTQWQRAKRATPRHRETRVCWAQWNWATRGGTCLVSPPTRLLATCRH